MSSLTPPSTTFAVIALTSRHSSDEGESFRLPSNLTTSNGFILTDVLAAEASINSALSKLR